MLQSLTLFAQNGANWALNMLLTKFTKYNANLSQLALKRSISAPLHCNDANKVPYIKGARTKMHKYLVGKTKEKMY